MRIAILGDRGSMTAELVHRALCAGYDVQALAQDTSKLYSGMRELTVRKGDVTTGEGIRLTIAGCPFVVWAPDSTSRVVQGMALVIRDLWQSRSLRRFVFVSSLGTNESLSQAAMASGPFPVLRLKLRTGLNEMGQAEDMLRATTLPYLILRPARLTNGGVTHRVVAVDADDRPPGHVSRSDVAEYALGVLDAPGLEGAARTIGTRRAGRVA